MDDLDFEPTVPVRVAGRFRPKAKPKLMKVASTVVASDLPNVAAESSSLGTDKETVLSAISIDAGVVKVKDPVESSSAASEIVRNLEPSENNEHVCSSVPSLDGDRGTDPSELAAADTLQPSVVASNRSEGGADSVFRKTAWENADMFSGSECFDNLPAQTTVPASRSTEKVNEGKCGALPHCSVESSAILVSDVAETQVDYCATQDLMSRTIAANSNEHSDIQLETPVDKSFSEFEVLDLVSVAPISTGCLAGKLHPKLGVKKGQENSNIPHSKAESPSLSEAADFETGDMDESSSPTFPAGDDCDPVCPASSDSKTPNPTPDFQVNAESHVESTYLDEPIDGDAPHSDSVCGRGRKNGNGKASTPSNLPQKRKAADKEAKGGTSSKKSRKQSPSQQVEGPGQKTNEEGSIAANSSDFHGNEGIEHNEKQRKRTPRKSESAVSENENPVQRRKRTKKAPDESNEETTKKKFSHSTRKNRRSVDKSLLEIPDEDFDPQKYPLKDLIRRHEHLERLAIKEAAKSKTPVANERSSYNDLDNEASRNEEENFGLEQERGSDDDQMGYICRASMSSSSLNYQTYMNKAPVARWSKQETELFYEGLAQFGPDFSMMAQLFPNRTRHQIKLKFKKEDRQNPLLISEAFRRHSKDNSKYILVINQLQKGSKEKQESNANDVTSQDVEMTHENDEGATKLESDEIQDTGTEVADEVPDEEAAAAEVHSPVKSNRSDDGKTFGGWDDDF